MSGMLVIRKESVWWSQSWMTLLTLKLFPGGFQEESIICLIVIFFFLSREPPPLKKRNIRQAKLPFSNKSPGAEQKPRTSPETFSVSPSPSTESAPFSGNPDWASEQRFHSHALVPLPVISVHDEALCVGRPGDRAEHGLISGPRPRAPRPSHGAAERRLGGLPPTCGLFYTEVFLLPA